MHQAPMQFTLNLSFGPVLAVNDPLFRFIAIFGTVFNTVCLITCVTEYFYFVRNKHIFNSFALIPPVSRLGPNMANCYLFVTRQPIILINN